MAKVSTGGAAVDLFDAAVITFDGGALGSLSGAATLPDGNPYQVDIRIFGTEGVLLLDTERERVSLHRYDGAQWDLDIEPGAGAYECIVPPNRFIDLITGASTENNSDAVVAARSVELIDAMLRSRRRRRSRDIRAHHPRDGGRPRDRVQGSPRGATASSTAPSRWPGPSPPSGSATLAPT